MVVRSSLHRKILSSGYGLMATMILTGDMKSLPARFERTSDLPYDRNWYKVWCIDNSVKIIQDYDDVINAWFNFKQYISHVEVIDAKRITSPKGFK